jgi:hypothetical protein
MGMFSFVCKGCGRELKQNEIVRLNGCVGEFDGYGRAGDFEYSGSYDEPRAWHEKCFQEATPEQKLDMTPSKHARNQGFGYPLAIFIDAPTVAYSILAYQPYVEGAGRHDVWLLNQHGFMAEDRCFSYESEDDNEDEQRELWCKVMPPELAEEALAYNRRVATIPYEEKNWDELDKEWQKLSPLRPKRFETIEEALAAIESLSEEEWPDVAVMGMRESGGQTGVVKAIRGQNFSD